MNGSATPPPTAWSVNILRFLARVVRQCNGSVVKTIGDAVMAAFNDPADAIHAAVQVQQGVIGFNTDTAGEDIVIKLGCSLRALHRRHAERAL